jgi:small conductance mechanosensitive channel
MTEILSRLSETFSWTSISVFLADLMPKLIVAALTLFVYYLVWRLVGAGLKLLLRKAKVDVTAQRFVHLMVKYAILLVGLVAALGELGINTASLLTSLGIAGLTIGFAARDALSNIISGIFIFWDRPFVIGDLIEVGGLYGQVDTITMRSTRVVTPDGRMLAVPNAQVVNTTVVSYTNYPHLRIDIPVTIGTAEDLTRVRGLLTALTKDERFMPEPAPRVVVKAINDYNLEVELQAWLTDEKQHVAVRFELRERVFEALRTAGVDMPLETFQIRPVELVQKTA